VAEPIRCPWAIGPLMIAYHDHEWGIPVRNDVRLFELLSLAGAQAGLSYETILRKREGYRRAFGGFDPARVARFTPARIERLVGDAEIVRNRRKIESVVTNARAVLALRRSHGSFARYVWGFVDDTPIRNRRRTIKQIPATTPVAERLSTDLRKHGFRFVGPTIAYAFMQSAGLVNDHLLNCAFRGK
jgi:DNA-3-methyladenine glycosylase I